MHGRAVPCNQALRRSDRKTGKDGGAEARRRFDLELTTQEQQPLAHSGKPKSSAWEPACSAVRQRGVKATPVVLDGYLQSRPLTAYDDADGGSALCMLGDIGESLPDNPVDGYARLIREVVEHAVTIVKIHFHTKLGTPLAGMIRQRVCKPKSVDCRRPQFR